MNTQDQSIISNQPTINSSQPTSNELSSQTTSLYQINYQPVPKQLFHPYNWFDKNTTPFIQTGYYPSFNSHSFQIQTSHQTTTANKPVNSQSTPLKPHPCGEPNCSLFFRRIEHARRHRDGVHFKLKPHICPFEHCGKRFARSDNLRQHIKSIHRKSSIASI